MTRIPALLLLILTITLAAGDISTNNIYYTDGAEIRDTVSVEGAEFSNFVGITLTDVIVSGSGWSNESESAFYEQIRVHSGDDRLGAVTSMQGAKPSWSRSASAGNTERISFSYDLGSGRAEASGYNPHTSMQGEILLENNTYSGSLLTTPQDMSMEGQGTRISQEDEESGFEQNIMLGHMGKWCRIEYGLNTEKVGTSEEDNLFDLPAAIYTWKASANSQGADWAMAGVELNMVAGSHAVNAYMNGNSSSLQPKHLQPVKMNPLLMKEDPEIIDVIRWIEELNVTRSQYMYYNLTGDSTIPSTS